MRRGIALRVVAPSDETTGTGELDGIPVYRVKSTLRDAYANGDGLGRSLRSPVRWGSLIRLWRALSAAAKREVAAGADLVHAHWWLPAALASPADVPTVLTVHGPDASLLRHSRLARSLARRLFHRAAVVTTVSRQVGEWVQNAAGRHVGPGNIHPMPIDTRAHPWTRGGGGAVLIGSLIESSRVTLAIETAAVLASCGHDLPLTVVGDGPDRATLEQRAAGLGIPSLIR